MRWLGVNLLGNGPKPREGEDIVEGAGWIEVVLEGTLHGMCANIKTIGYSYTEGLDSPGGPTWGYNQETGAGMLRSSQGLLGLDFAEFQELRPLEGQPHHWFRHSV